MSRTLVFRVITPGWQGWRVRAWYPGGAFLSVGYVARLDAEAEAHRFQPR